MRTTTFALAFSLALALPAHADEPCPVAVAAARRAADKEVKDGHAKAALARLAAVKERCFATLEPGVKLWLVSDMAFAAFKAGDKARCAELIGGVDDEAAAKNPKATKALLYNAGLCAPKEDCDYKLDHDEPVCRMKLALEYSERNELTGFAATPCDIPGHKDAVKLGAGTCLEAAGFQRRGDEDITCPSIYLVEGKGKRRKLALGKDGGGWLTSPSDCCAVRTIEVKSAAGQTSVLIGSDGLSRDCFGGTATTDFLTLFKLVGTTLEMEKDLSISWH